LACSSHIAVGSAIEFTVLSLDELVRTGRDSVRTSIEALGDELAPYLAGKGTIRFATDAPIPVDLVTKVVKVRLAEVGPEMDATG